MPTLSEVKRKILKRLYHFYHEESARGSMDTGEIFRNVGVEVEADFYEALQSLHDEDFVEGTPIPFRGQGYLKSAKITQKGVDAVDDSGEFDRLFPEDDSHVAFETFIQDVRLEIKRSGIPEDEKDGLLESLQTFVGNPSMQEVLGRALSRKKS